jgi:prephenate dehydrogenase
MPSAAERDRTQLSLAVVGLGLIGGSILKAASSHASVCGYDINPSVRTLATADGYEVAESLEEAVKGRRIVVVATPPSACAATILSALASNDDATTIDTCSVKQKILDEVLSTDPEGARRYVPAHPLGGGLDGGYESASAHTLANSPWAVCPHPLLESARLWESICLISDLAGSVIGCEADVHDLVLAYSSHAPVLAAAGLATYIPEPICERAQVLHGTNLRDGIRAAGSDPHLWQEIVESNRENIVNALNELIIELQRLRKIIKDDGDVESALTRARTQAQAARARRWMPHPWLEETWTLNTLQERLLLAGTRAQAVRSRAANDVGALPVLVRTREIPHRFPLKTLENLS